MIMSLKKKQKSDKKRVNETSTIKAQMEFNKNFADRLAELRMIMKEEKDPIKREKMQSRLALGVLDFSDL